MGVEVVLWGVEWRWVDDDGCEGKGGGGGCCVKGDESVCVYS